MTITHALEACLGCLVAGFVFGAIYWNRVKKKAAADLANVAGKLGS